MELLKEVLSAGGQVPLSSGRRTPVIHRAVEVLTNPASLARRQRNDAHLGQVSKRLREDSNANAAEVDETGYSLDENDVIRFADGKGRNLPAIPESMVADVLALVHTLHGHSGVGATLALVLRALSLAFSHSRHATIRVVMRVQET